MGRNIDMHVPTKTLVVNIVSVCLGGRLVSVGETHNYIYICVSHHSGCLDNIMSHMIICTHISAWLDTNYE